MSEMATGEMGTPTKSSKTSTSLDPPPSTSPMPYQDWATAFQAYYSTGMSPLPPPGYFPSAVGSGPQPHPYMWGAQALMPPYGIPSPYAAMYPPGGMYAHPSLPPGTHPYGPYNMATGNPSEAQGAATSAGTDGEGKSAEGKPKTSAKKFKASAASVGMLNNKESDPAKGNSGTMNGALSRSGDSGSEGSTEGSDDDSQNGLQGSHKDGFDQVISEGPFSHMVNSATYGNEHDVAANHPVVPMPLSIGGKQAVGSGPLTNLNIGGDYWSGGAPGGHLATTRGKQVTSAAATTTALIPSPNMMGPARDELWLQDERELKRQRRKQSNRESARRSRLRKQAECEELAARVDTLNKENTALREDLARITEECNKLSEENSSLLDQLQISEPAGIHGGMQHNVMEGSVQLDSGSLERDAQDANEALSLTGSSSVDYAVGNLVVSSS